MKYKSVDKYKSESLMRKRLRKFRSLKRGYTSFLIIITLYIVSFFCPLLMNYKALVVKYNGNYYFPIVKYRLATFFHQDIQGSTLFKSESLKQPGIFLAKLRDSSDPVSRYISNKLSSETLDLIYQHFTSFKEPDELLKTVKNVLTDLSSLEIDFAEQRFTEDEFNSEFGRLTQVFAGSPGKDELISFSVKLLEKTDPIYKFISKQFNYGALNRFKEYCNSQPISDDLQALLDEDIRKILKNDALYSEERFAEVKLSPETIILVKENPDGKERIRLNRMLFGEAYANEITREKIHGEANYRRLKQQFKEVDEGNWVLMPAYPFGPYETLLDKTGEPPNRPSAMHWFGTDDRGRDVFVRLAYGFNTSLSFAVCVLLFTYIIGVSVGAFLGYFGGKFDIIAQRFIEIWSSLPFLYTVIIVSSLVQPNFALLVFVLMIFRWTGMTYFIRGEFYREKAKDYVHAAIAMGASNQKIIFKHILPNALTPVITFAPFGIVSLIGALVGLDYLGFGLPPPTASWGEMIRQGMSNIFSWWLVLFPFSMLFFTLLLVVFVGEAVREAFDPRVFSRLR